MSLNVAEKAPSSISLDHKDIVTEVEDPRIVDFDDYPDGGLRAWSIVLGVRFALNFHDSFTNILGLCCKTMCCNLST